MTSANGASGSGLTNVTAPPMTTSGSRARCASARGDTREAEKRHDVRVVPLERDRKREDVELGRRGVCDSSVSSGVPGLELGLQFLFRRQKYPLADHIVQIVEQPVDGLEPEARHPDVVGIRETPAPRAGGRRAACARSRLRARACRARVRDVPSSSLKCRSELRKRGDGRSRSRTICRGARDEAQAASIPRAVDIPSVPRAGAGPGEVLASASQGAPLSNRGTEHTSQCRGRGRVNRPSLASLCRRRNAGTSSGETGSNSAPGIMESFDSFASGASGGGAVRGRSSTARRVNGIREPPAAATRSPLSCFHDV